MRSPAAGTTTSPWRSCRSRRRPPAGPAESPQAGHQGRDDGLAEVRPDSGRRTGTSGGDDRPSDVARKEESAKLLAKVVGVADATPGTVRRRRRVPGPAG
ncbi:hypothetical protein [Streptomyces endophytica]|uniref:hypothetical protein n=1 Tax=Streptomyces endophytica TaxID=2991496 RepID=UPI003C6FDF8F